MTSMAKPPESRQEEAEQLLGALTRIIKAAMSSKYWEPCPQEFPEIYAMMDIVDLYYRKYYGKEP